MLSFPLDPFDLSGQLERVTLELEDQLRYERVTSDSAPNNMKQLRT